MARALRNASSIVYGAIGRPNAPTTSVLLRHFAGTRFNSSASSFGIGMDFLDVSV